jgi:hypothetical protein
MLAPVALVALVAPPASRAAAQSVTVGAAAAVSGASSGSGGSIAGDGFESPTPITRAVGGSDSYDFSLIKSWPGASVTVRASATSVADYGFIKLSAFTSAASTASSVVGSVDSRAVASATATVNDFGTFSLAGYSAGTVVTLRAYVSASGGVGGNSIGTAGTQSQIGWSAQIGGAFTSGSGFTRVNSEGTIGTPLPNNLFFFSATVALGARTQILYSAGVVSNAVANARCTGDCSAHADGNADFSHTFLWGGISEVRLADGSLVDLSLLSMESGSGFNYITPGLELPPAPGTPPTTPNGPTTVPEPSTVVLLAAGLGALVAVRRRAAGRG